MLLLILYFAFVQGIVDYLHDPDGAHEWPHSFDVSLRRQSLVTGGLVKVNNETIVPAAFVLDTDNGTCGELLQLSLNGSVVLKPEDAMGVDYDRVRALVAVSGTGDVVALGVDRGMNNGYATDCDRLWVFQRNETEWSSVQELRLAQGSGCTGDLAVNFNGTMVAVVSPIGEGQPAMYRYQFDFESYQFPRTRSRVTVFARPNADLTTAFSRVSDGGHQYQFSDDPYEWHGHGLFNDLGEIRLQTSGTRPSREDFFDPVLDFKPPRIRFSLSSERNELVVGAGDTDNGGAVLVANLDDQGHTTAHRTYQPKRCGRVHSRSAQRYGTDLWTEKTVPQVCADGIEPDNEFATSAPYSLWRRVASSFCTDILALTSDFASFDLRPQTVIYVQIAYSDVYPGDQAKDMPAILFNAYDGNAELANIEPINAALTRTAMRRFFPDNDDFVVSEKDSAKYASLKFTHNGHHCDTYKITPSTGELFVPLRLVLELRPFVPEQLEVPLNRTKLAEIANSSPFYEISIIEESDLISSLLASGGSCAATGDIQLLGLSVSKNFVAQIHENNVHFNEAECKFGDSVAMSANGVVSVGGRMSGLNALKDDEPISRLVPYFTQFISPDELSSRDDGRVTRVIRTDVSPRGTILVRLNVKRVTGGVLVQSFLVEVNNNTSFHDGVFFRARRQIRYVNHLSPPVLWRYETDVRLMNGQAFLYIFGGTCACVQHNVFNASLYPIDDVFFDDANRPPRAALVSPTVDAGYFEPPSLSTFSTVLDDGCIDPVEVSFKETSAENERVSTFVYWSLQQSTRMSLASLFQADDTCSRYLTAEVGGASVSNPLIVDALVGNIDVPVAWFRFRGNGGLIKTSTGAGATVDSLLAVFRTSSASSQCSVSPDKCVMASTEEGFYYGADNPSVAGFDAAATVSFCSKTGQDYLLMVAGTSANQTGAVIVEVEYNWPGKSCPYQPFNDELTSISVIHPSAESTPSSASRPSADVIAGDFEASDETGRRVRAWAWRDRTRHLNCLQPRADNVLSCLSNSVTSTSVDLCDQPYQSGCRTPPASLSSSLHLSADGLNNWFNIAWLQNEFVVPFERTLLTYSIRPSWSLVQSDMVLSVEFIISESRLQTKGIDPQSIKHMVYFQQGDRMYLKGGVVMTASAFGRAWTYGWLQFQTDWIDLAGHEVICNVRLYDQAFLNTSLSRVPFRDEYRLGFRGGKDTASFYFDNLHFEQGNRSAIRQPPPIKSELTFPQPLLIEWAIPTSFLGAFILFISIASCAYVGYTSSTGNPNNGCRIFLEVILALWSLGSVCLAGYALYTMSQFQASLNDLDKNLVAFRKEKLSFVDDGDYCFENYVSAALGPPSVTGDRFDWGEGGFLLPPGTWTELIETSALPDKEAIESLDRPLYVDFEQQGNESPECFSSTEDRRFHFRTKDPPDIYADMFATLRFDPAPDVTRFRTVLQASVIIDMLAFVVYCTLVTIACLRSWRRRNSQHHQHRRNHRRDDCQWYASCVIDSFLFGASSAAFVFLLYFATQDPVEFDYQAIIEPLLSGTASFPVKPSPAFFRDRILVNGSQSLSLSLRNKRWCDPEGSLLEQTARNISFHLDLASPETHQVTDVRLARRLQSGLSWSSNFYTFNVRSMAYTMTSQRVLDRWFSNSFGACRFEDVELFPQDQCIEFNCDGTINFVNGTQLGEFQSFIQSFVSGGILLDSLMVIMDFVCIVAAYLVLGLCINRCCLSQSFDHGPIEHGTKSPGIGDGTELSHTGATRSRRHSRSRAAVAIVSGSHSPRSSRAQQSTLHDTICVDPDSGRSRSSSRRSRTRSRRSSVSIQQ